MNCGVFLTQEKKHKKDAGRFTIVFVTKLFTQMSDNNNMSTSMTRIKSPPLNQVSYVQLSIVGFSYTRKEAEKGCWKVYDCFCYEIIYILSDE